MTKLPLTVVLLIVITAASVGGLVSSNILLVQMNTALDNQDTAIDNISKIIQDQEIERKNANITTKQFVDKFNHLVEGFDNLSALQKSAKNDRILMIEQQADILRQLEILVAMNHTIQPQQNDTTNIQGNITAG